MITQLDAHIMDGPYLLTNHSLSKRNDRVRYEGEEEKGEVVRIRKRNQERGRGKCKTRERENRVAIYKYIERKLCLLLSDEMQIIKLWDM